MFFFDAADLQKQGVTACDGYLNCWYTMLRYCYFDQNGFNFMWDLYPAHRLMFYGSILYLMVAALGILFGILAIFGAPFEVLENVVESSTQAEERNLLDQLDNVLLLLKSRSKALDELERAVQARKKQKMGRKIASFPPTHDKQDPDNHDDGATDMNIYNYRSDSPDGGLLSKGTANELENETSGAIETGLSPSTQISPLGQADLEALSPDTIVSEKDTSVNPSTSGARANLHETPDINVAQNTIDLPIDRDAQSPSAKDLEGNALTKGTIEQVQNDISVNTTTDPITLQVVENSLNGGDCTLPSLQTHSSSTAELLPDTLDDG